MNSTWEEISKSVHGFIENLMSYESLIPYRDAESKFSHISVSKLINGTGGTLQYIVHREVRRSSSKVGGGGHLPPVRLPGSFYIAACHKHLTLQMHLFGMNIIFFRKWKGWWLCISPWAISDWNACLWKMEIWFVQKKFMSFSSSWGKNTVNACFHR